MKFLTDARYNQLVYAECAVEIRECAIERLIEKNADLAMEASRLRREVERLTENRDFWEREARTLSGPLRLVEGAR